MEAPPQSRGAKRAPTTPTASKLSPSLSTVTAVTTSIRSLQVDPAMTISLTSAMNKGRLHLGTATSCGALFNKTGFEELKPRIFEAIKDTSKQDLIRALSVCKEWNRIASPLIWKHIAVANNNILVFIRSLVSVRLNTIDLIQNLSTYIRPAEEKSILTRGAGSILAHKPDGMLLQYTGLNTQRLIIPAIVPYIFKNLLVHKIGASLGWNIVIMALRELFHLVKIHLRSLKYASFRAADRCDAGTEYRVYDDNTLPRDILSAFLRSLPESCTSVELDDCGRTYHASDETPSEHFCSTLSSILPRMEHVQIKVTDICPSILGCNPNLQSLHINVHPSTECQDIVDDYCAKYSSFSNDTGKYRKLSEEPGVSNKRRQVALAVSLRERVEHGAFPNIRSCKVLNKHNNYEWIIAPQFFVLNNIIDKTSQLIPTNVSYLFRDEGEEGRETAVALHLGQELYCSDRNQGKIIQSLVDDGWFSTCDDLRFPKLFDGPKLIQVDPLDSTKSNSTLSRGKNDQDSTSISLHGSSDSEPTSTLADRAEDDDAVFFSWQDLRVMKPQTIGGLDWNNDHLKLDRAE